MKTCIVENCDRTDVHGHGLCNKHYLRFLKYGDPLAMKQAKKGEGTKCKCGYIKLGKNNVYKFAHVFAAEKVLGRNLRGTEEVHHVNGDRSYNKNSNLVICPDRAYHMLLHVRARALDECGNAGYKKCIYCHQYDSPENQRPQGIRRSRFYHLSCRREDRRARAYAARVAGGA